MNERALPVLSLTGLCVKNPHGETLLRDASIQLVAGDVVLLIGPTGSGKSSVLRILAGLLGHRDGGWTVAGRLSFGGREIDLARESYPVAGMVFQNCALFDDLSVRDNLSISSSHAVNSSGPAAELVGVLVDKVPPDAAVTTCSGGQQQLAAIARTLLAGPAVVLLDEPNSGLDICHAQRLVTAIESIKSRSDRPLLITAHHFHHLLPVATRLIFLDPTTKSLIPIDGDPDDIEARLRGCERDSASSPHSSTDDRASPKLKPDVARKRSSLFWAARYFCSYMWHLCLSPEALLYMGFGALLIGFVSTWFTFRNIPLASYSGPLFHEELLAGIGFSQFRILVPLITCVLLASRNGAIVAADQSHRVFTQQIEAMRNLHIPVNVYLTANILLAMLVGAGISLVFILGLSAWVSLATWALMFPDGSRSFWQDHFFASLWQVGRLMPLGSGWVVAKTVISTLGIGSIGILLGRARKTSVLDLNRAIALAITLSLATVLLVHTAAAFLEF